MIAHVGEMGRGAAARRDKRDRRQVVCILCPGGLDHAGGIGRAIGNLMSALAESSPAPRIELLDTRGTGHVALSPLHLARALGRIVVLRLSGRLALLHVNLSTHGSALRKFVVCCVAAALAIPVVLHVHAGRFATFHGGLPRPLQAGLRWMFRRAERVVVLGARWKQLVVTELGVAPDRVEVICNGVRPPPAGERVGGQDDGRLHLVFIGRLCPPKGVGELLDALASPELRDLPWRATLAGDGDGDPYRALAARLGIADRIAFPGWLGRKAVERLLADADILALPSHVEGLPLSVLEALACRVPVVATPVGSLPEFVADGESVLFVPPRDARALADALRRLVLSADLRAHLADAGFAAFRRHFDVRVVAAQVLALYQLVTSRQRIVGSAAAGGVAPGRPVASVGQR